MTTSTTADADSRESLPISTKARWAGRVLSGLPVLGLLLSATMKLTHAAGFVANWQKAGFQEGLLTPIGLLEVLCTVLYLVPRTAILGAILLTGYLGGAIVTHLRVGEPFVVPFVFGVLLWGGLFLREPRLRVLIPLR